MKILLLGLSLLALAACGDDPGSSKNSISTGKKKAAITVSAIEDAATTEDAATDNAGCSLTLEDSIKCPTINPETVTAESAAKLVKDNAESLALIENTFQGNQDIQEKINLAKEVNLNEFKIITEGQKLLDDSQILDAEADTATTEAEALREEAYKLKYQGEVKISTASKEAYNKVHGPGAFEILKDSEVKAEAAE